ncbi:MAG: hypothetical protein WCK31_04545 [bacterium]
MTEITFAMILINKKTKEYFEANRKDKGVILDQLEKDTGRFRKSILMTLRSTRRKLKPNNGRPRIFGYHNSNYSN